MIFPPIFTLSVTLESGYDPNICQNSLAVEVKKSKEVKGLVQGVHRVWDLGSKYSRKFCRFDCNRVAQLAWVNLVQLRASLVFLAKCLRWDCICGG